MQTCGRGCPSPHARISFMVKTQKTCMWMHLFENKNSKSCLCVCVRVKWKQDVEEAEAFKSLVKHACGGFSAYKLMIVCHQDEFGWHLRLNGLKCPLYRSPRRAGGLKIILAYGWIKDCRFVSSLQFYQISYGVFSPGVPAYTVWHLSGKMNQV